MNTNAAKISSWIRTNIGLALLLSMFLGSLLLNLKLAWSLRPTERPLAGVAVGADLRTVPVLTSTGQEQVLRLGQGKPTVVYVMAPTCVWCARNLENIRVLANRTGAGYDFLGLSNTQSGLTEHLKLKPLPFPVFAINDAHLPKGLDPGPTPQLVVVDSSGRVEKVWRGALQPRAQAEVEAYFHTSLPGLLAPGV